MRAGLWVLKITISFEVSPLINRSSDGTISRLDLYLVLVENLAQHLHSLFQWNRMNIYKVSARVSISDSPAPRSRFGKTFSSSSSCPSETHERIRSGFPFLFYMTKNFFRNGISNLEWNCWETHAGVCTVTVMVIRRFSFEGNIMMTLKLDLKHISEREGKVSGGSGRRGQAGGSVESASSELLCGWDPDVRAWLLLYDQLDFIIDLI